MGASKFEPSAFASIVCESTGVHLKLNRKFGGLFVCVPLVVRRRRNEGLNARHLFLMIHKTSTTDRVGS